MNNQVVPGATEVKDAAQFIVGVDLLMTYKRIPAYELALRVGVSSAYLSIVMSGKRRLRPETASAIAKALEVNITTPELVAQAVEHAILA